MSETENKQMLRRYYEDVLTQGRLEVLDEIARPDHVEHNPFPGHGQGIEGLRQRDNTLHSSFKPELNLEDVIA